MDIVHFFKRSIEKNKLSHLYMIVGPAGDQRTEIILDVIQVIHGIKYKSKAFALESSQIHWIEAENMQIKKQQITQLQEEFSKTSLSDGKRIYVIEDIEKLNTQSANALLKFLEEPLSTETIGLLLTNQPDIILETILSRSQRLDMFKSSKKDMIQFLKTIDSDEAIKQVIAEITKDSLEAEVLIQSPEIIHFTSILKQIPKYLDSKINFESYLLESTKAFSENQQMIQYFIQIMYRLLLDIKKKETLSFHFLEENKNDWINNIRFDKIDDILETLKNISYELNYNIYLDTARRQLIHALREVII